MSADTLKLSEEGAETEVADLRKEANALLQTGKSGDRKKAVELFAKAREIENEGKPKTTWNEERSVVSTTVFMPPITDDNNDIGVDNITEANLDLSRNGKLVRRIVAVRYNLVRLLKDDERTKFLAEQFNCIQTSSTIFPDNMALRKEKKLQRTLDAADRGLTEKLRELGLVNEDDGHITRFTKAVNDVPRKHSTYEADKYTPDEVPITDKEMGEFLKGERKLTAKQKEALLHYLRAWAVGSRIKIVGSVRDGGKRFK